MIPVDFLLARSIAQLKILMDILLQPAVYIFL